MDAPGRPGIPPTWSSSAKDLVTTSLGPSRLWVTVGHGIVNEVYTPTTGEPQIRDLGFIVATPGGWHEVKRAARYTITTPEPFVPLPTVVHEGEDYRLTLELLPDALRETLLVRYALEGDGARLYPLLAPHLGARGADNTAWVDDGMFARDDRASLCLLAGAAFARASAGFVGASDGWQDFDRHGAMTWQFDRAAHGNVALMGELRDHEGVLALAFAASPEGARTLARSSLAEGFTAVREAFVAGWRDWAAGLLIPDAPEALRREGQLSAMVLKVHEDKRYPGAVVASLSVPWGNRRDDLGGYHLVWARDAVEAGLGLLAAGQVEDARRMLAYLVATQNPDGHWAQNFFPDGTPYWKGIQLDEVGFPVLLAAALRERDELRDERGVDAMVTAAAGYLARSGPVSDQDRWEENAGISPFTLAIEVAALVAAAPFLTGVDQAYALSLADFWNERIEAWTWVAGGRWAADAGVDGYYVRIAAPPADGGLSGRIEVRNRAGLRMRPDELVSMDFLYLARLGLRAADDPRMRATLRVAERLLRVDTPNGVAFRRYNEDGYGEHADGEPFDGTGIGRAWPLLAGERGHLALQLGEDPLPWLRAMAAMTGPGGLIPEQVWDADPIPERALRPGAPTGSAMPLTWAHAEFLKLLAAAERGRPLELLDGVAKRYGAAPPRAARWHWRLGLPFAAMPAERALMVEAAAPFALSLEVPGGGARRLESAPIGLGMHAVELLTQVLADRDVVAFRLLADGTDAQARHEIRLARGAPADGL